MFLLRHRQNLARPVQGLSRAPQPPGLHSQIPIITTAPPVHGRRSRVSQARPELPLDRAMGGRRGAVMPLVRNRGLHRIRTRQTSLVRLCPGGFLVSRLLDHPSTLATPIHKDQTLLRHLPPHLYQELRWDQAQALALALAQVLVVPGGQVLHSLRL